MGKLGFNAVRIDLRRALWRAGPAGVTARQLARAVRSFRALSVEDRYSELQSMVRDGLCVRRYGKPPVFYVDADFSRRAALP